MNPGSLGDAKTIMTFPKFHKTQHVEHFVELCSNNTTIQCNTTQDQTREKT